MGNQVASIPLSRQAMKKVTRPVPLWLAKNLDERIQNHMSGWIPLPFAPFKEGKHVIASPSSTPRIGKIPSFHSGCQTHFRAP
ncbi:hypothetical protein Pelo_16875 [Pelomyxa schiedti]|nr:hypothetical protein Pelo_16875 [Pelomyxa schiedti]